MMMTKETNDATRSGAEEEIWISADEARSMLKVGEWKFREICNSGKLPVHRVGYRTLRFLRSDVLDYMRGRSAPKRNRG